MHSRSSLWLLLVAVLALSACDEASSSDDGESSSDTTATAGTSATSGVGGATSGTGGASTSGAGGGGGSGWTPDPIPTLDEEPSAPCDAALTDPYYFQYLDNLCDEKRYPSVMDRDRACPMADDSPTITRADGTTITYTSSSDPIVVDSEALKGLVPDEMNVVVILIRRVNGVPYYRYLSNGSHDTPYQPWSTTKFFAAANAASLLRIQSSYTVGLTADVDGYALGDLITSIHNYDYSPYSSNSLGRYFHNIGGRDRANDLVHALWLNRPASETFGGNYGEVEPPLGYHFVEPTGESVDITPDTTFGYANNLSAFTMAEVVKRLVLHREEASQRLPGIQWKDLRVLLYGAENSAKYAWGGMTADTAIYLQAAHDMDYIEARSHGQWTTFSKLGLGTSGQFLDVGYACYPVLDPEGNAVPGWGREFVIAAHLPTGGATWRERDRLLATYYRKIVLRIVDGRL